MQAVVVEKYDSIQNIRLKQVPLPEVPAGHVRVRIEAASVGFVDGLKVQGLYQTKDALPFTPGSEPPASSTKRRPMFRGLRPACR
jgi:NADPH2:quinone reductase